LWILFLSSRCTFNTMHATSNAYGYEQMQYSGYASTAQSPSQYQHHEQTAYSQYNLNNNYQGYVATASCAVCYVQSVEAHGAVCSRRCEWVAHGCCPQCGRHRSAGGQFCNPICAAEARQANWCVCCGVRQLSHGAATCGAPVCTATAQRVMARLPSVHSSHQPRRSVPHQHGSGPHSPAALTKSAQPQRGGGSRLRFESHTPLTMNDKVVVALRQQLGQDVAKRLVAVIKVGGSVEERKRYTAYRCRVEAEMNESNGIGAPKFGHGGEGNEQKRFIPLRSECGMSAFSAGEVRSCGSSACEVCTLLELGIRATCHSAAMPAFSAVLAAAEGASGPEGAEVVAVATCRVTIGNANVVESSAVDEASGSVPSPGPKQHATVITHDTHDVAYVAVSEPTVDPLFILFLRS
jgi:hypothetical protein